MAVTASKAILDEIMATSEQGLAERMNGNGAKTMNSHLTSNFEPALRILQDNELDAVIGGGTLVGPVVRVNMSPWSINPSHDPTWDLVGITGHL
jgi:hypothetical protein